MNRRNFLIEVCPRLLRRWHTDKIHNLDVQITKMEVNKATSKLSIFCGSEKHNCFCDSFVKKHPDRIVVAKGKDDW